MSDPRVQEALDWLRAAARETAARLAAAKDKTPRWIGKDALRAFAKADARQEEKST